MELGLSLGDASKPFNFLATQQQKPTIKNKKFDLCMHLGLNTTAITKQEPEKTRKLKESNDQTSEIDDDNQRVASTETSLQLNVLHVAPRMIPSQNDYGNYKNLFPAVVVKDIRNDVVEADKESSRASDDDDENINRKKLRLSKQQSDFLEQRFKEHNTLNTKQKLSLAKQLNLRARQVEVWFQNRRARTKLKQTELDYEYLKKCFEKLSEDNKRLHKELQDLRALKYSNPFYMYLPPTTLTTCPSCENVATSQNRMHS